MRVSLICILMLIGIIAGSQDVKSSSSTIYNPMNAICNDSVKLTLNVNATDTTGELRLLLFVPGIFDEMFEYSVFEMQSQNGHFETLVPIETSVTNLGIKLLDESGPLLVGMVTLTKDKDLIMEASPNPDGEWSVKINDESGFNTSIMTNHPGNQGAELSEIMMRFCAYHQGQGKGEPSFETSDFNDWNIVTQKLDSLYEVRKRYALDSREIPLDKRDWVENNMKCIFAVSWRLPIVERIDSTLLLPVVNKEPPVEYFNFLREIDLSEKLLDRTIYSGLYTFMRSLLVHHPLLNTLHGNLSQTERRDRWRAALDKNGVEATEFLLDMLAATRLQMQIDRAVPLDSCQIKDMEAELPYDLVSIIKNHNSTLLKELADKDRRIDLKDGQFSFDKFISDKFEGHPVVVDVWESWCGICISMQGKIAKMGLEEKYPDVRFLYICSTETSDEQWIKYAANQKGTSLRISESDKYALLKRYQFTGLPAVLYLDANHCIISSSEGFTGMRDFEKELKRISRKGE